MTTPKKLPRLDLNPSSADRWTTCTASPRFILENWDKVPPSDSIFNLQGTTAHEVGAAYLQDREPGETPVPIDADMRWHGWNYMEYVQGLQEKGHITTVETKYPLWYMPERNAMVDVGILNPRSIHIVDYKYGEGIPVSPVENLQGAIYARSIIHNFNAKSEGLSPDFPVTIHIFQPRGRNSEDGAAHFWETTWGELKEFTHERIAKQAWVIQASEAPKVPDWVTWDRAEIPELQFAPSDKACQWCPAKGFCTARMKHLTADFENLAVIEEKAPTLPAADTITDEQAAAILKHGPEIKKWIDGVAAYQLDRMRAGHPLPGYKLVLSRGGNRYWSDPQKAAELLVSTTILKKHEVVEETTIGPAAAEKLLGKHKFGADLMNLIAKAPGSPVIAPLEDKREAIGGNAALEFTNLDTTSEPTE